MQSSIWRAKCIQVVHFFQPFLLGDIHRWSAWPFFSPNGRSIALATMLQTNHSLLYLSVSFTHLKRSTDSASLIARETCPFPLGLLKNGLRGAIRLSWAAITACVYVQCGMSERVFSSLFLPFFLEHARVHRPLLHSIVTVFKARGQCAVLSSSGLRLGPFEGLTNDSCPPWVCVQNMTQAVVGEGKWQQRQPLKFGKNDGWGLGRSNINCPVQRKPWYDYTWVQAVQFPPRSRARKEWAKGDPEVQNLGSEEGKKNPLSRKWFIFWREHEGNCFL